MKYRKLSIEELEPLNEEFLKYLLVANITPENWEILKKDSPEECEKHIEVFSDLVFEKILQDVNFVDIVLAHRIECYHFQKEQVILYALEAKNKSSIDFSQDALENVNWAELNLIQGSKKYSKERKLEIFEVLQKANATISKGELFKQIVLQSVSK